MTFYHSSLYRKTGAHGNLCQRAWTRIALQCPVRSSRKPRTIRPSNEACTGECRSRRLGYGVRMMTFLEKRKKHRNLSKKGLTGDGKSDIIIPVERTSSQSPNERHTNHMEPWCSGLTCLPVTQKIAGSNPVGSGRTSVLSLTDPWFHQIS